MTFQVTIDGAPVKVAGWRMEQHVSGETTASFEMSSSVTVRPSSVIAVSDGKGVTWHGVARSVTRTGVAQKIEAIDTTTMRAWSIPTPSFKYGDVARLRFAPDITIMIVSGDSRGRNCIILNDASNGGPSDGFTWPDSELEAMDE